jgi:hypothetical protein
MNSLSLVLNENPTIELNKTNSSFWLLWFTVLVYVTLFFLEGVIELSIQNLCFCLKLKVLEKCMQTLGFCALIFRISIRKFINLRSTVKPRSPTLQWYSLPLSLSLSLSLARSLPFLPNLASYDLLILLICIYLIGFELGLSQFAGKLVFFFFFTLFVVLQVVVLFLL